MKKTVLITGATGGIGLAFTKLLAKKGYRLLLVSSSEKRLQHLKELLLRVKPNLAVEIYAEDLAVQGAAGRLYDRIGKDGWQVDVLINNAGFGMVGAAHTLDMEKEEQMLQLLVVTPTQLCKCCLRDIYKRGSGKILNVASVGAFQPGPYTASYYASKSYLYQYSQAIRLEAKKQGVQVCTLCPGSTRTHFFEKTGAKTPIWAMSPERVAKEAWEGLNADKAVVVPGMINRLLRLVPAQIKAYGVALLKKHT